MAITSFTASKENAIFGGKEIILTWVTDGSSATLSCDCYDGTGKKVAGTALSASSSVYIYPVTDTIVALTDDSGNTNLVHIKIGYDAFSYRLVGGRLV